MKITKKPTFQGVELDSKNELDFCHYLEELYKAGYIKEWYRNELSFKLTDGLIINYIVRLKTKEKYETQTLLKESVYTPDFIIIWNEKAKNIFYTCIDSKIKVLTPFVSQNSKDGQIMSYVETKPVFDQNGMTRLFINNQKFMWKIHKIFVSMVEPENVFKSSFTPTMVKIPVSRSTKQLKWKRITLDEYIKQKKHS